jgi:hypothetical protein
MLDSAFLVWNYKTDTGRNFNAALQCTLSDQLQCHSDRVQVSFPFAFAQMGLRVQKQKQQGLFDTRTQDLQLQVATTNDINSSSSQVMVHMTKSACHWYLLVSCSSPIVGFYERNQIDIL